MPSLPGLLPSPTFFGHDCEPTWWTSAPGPVGSPSLVPGLYVTDAILGGVTGRPVPAGTTVMATLTLQVAGGSGVYTLGLADGTFILVYPHGAG